MLIVNDTHRLLAGVGSLNEPCPYCSQPLRAYPLIMSDDAAQTVYHATCTVELATDILVDLFTFLSPPPRMSGSSFLPHLTQFLRSRSLRRTAERSASPGLHGIHCPLEQPQHPLTRIRQRFKVPFVAYIFSPTNGKVLL